MGAQNSKQGIHELDLAWNQIQGAGALALITALANQAKPTVCEHVCSLPLYHTGCSPTVSPQALDLSWNALGKHDDVVEALSSMLAKNSTLTHLDLSHNQMQGRHAETLSAGLNENTALVGLHVAGSLSVPGLRRTRPVMPT